MRLQTAIIAIPAILLRLLLYQYAAAQQLPEASNRKSGTICVLPNPPERPERISHGGDYNPATLTVQIDRRKPIRWPHEKPVRIEGLSLDERHLVVLVSDAKRIQSFRFRFADLDDARLCMSFDGYQGVQLMNKKEALWCKCK